MGDQLGTPPVRILLVEDDDNFRDALRGDLMDRGFLVQDFPDGTALLQVAGHMRADIIVLDWSMPGLSGIELLSRLRERGVTLPVVFLTGYNQAAREKRAFDSGAFDFVGKERGVDVLVRRLKVALAATNPGMTDQRPDRRYAYGKLVLDPAVNRAYWNGADLGLTVGEYKIVLLLACNAGRAVSNRSIYDKLHYEGFLAGNGLDGYRPNVRSAIKRIRRKFLDLDPSFDEIQAYQGFGYAWRSSEEKRCQGR